MQNFETIRDLSNILIVGEAMRIALAGEKRAQVQKARNELKRKEDLIERNGLMDSVNITQYKRLFFRLADLVLQYTLDEQLQELFIIFSRLFPQEMNHIYSFVHLYQFNRDSRERILLKGEVQSGKTLMMIMTALAYLLCGRDVYVLFRTKKDDKEQFKGRFEAVVQKLRESGFENESFVARDPKKGRIPAHACLFLQLYRVDNVSSLISHAKARDPSRAVLYVDEADMREQSKDTAFNKLCGIMGRTFFVSATVQDILVENWGIKGGAIVELFTSNYYRGLADVQIITEHFDSEFETMKSKLFFTLCDIAVDTEFNRTRPTHPKIVLLSTERYIDRLNDLFVSFKDKNWLIQDYNEGFHLPREMTDVCIIEYTGIGIRMFHESLERAELASTFTITDETNSIFTLDNTLVSKVLLWLAKNGGAARFPNILIIAGDMASRGINFASYDPFNRENNWHITHQVLLKSDQTTCATLKQACRLLGNHGDDIPLKLYTTPDIKRKLEMSDRLDRKVTRQMTDVADPNYREEYKELATHAICAQMSVMETEIPEKFLARKTVKKAFRVVKEEVVDEDFSEEIDGWLLPKHKKQQDIYDLLEEIIRENYYTLWISRSTVLKSVENRRWDIRDLLNMQSKERKGSNIAYKKLNNRIFYKLV